MVFGGGWRYKVDELIFGTDGWRDVIGDRFTFANVARVAQAYAEYLLDQGGEGTSVVVGYDTRFNGELFAEVVGRTLAANGLRVLFPETFLPTPVLSFAVKHHGAGGGVMLTASHNPPRYNGFKLKGPYGGTATEDIYREVGSRVKGIPPREVATVGGTSRIERLDVREAYYGWLLKLVDLDILGALEGTLLHDAMGGAACGWLSGFVSYADLPLEIREIHAEPHPLFFGVNPEPLARNLALLRESLRDNHALFGAATDGDGDRLGVVLPGGDFFNSHQIFAVLLDLLSSQNGSGKVVKTFTVSRVIERLAASRGLPVLETPVGFKHIVDAMLEGSVLIGGEESGGIGVAGHIPERDGIANTLLLLEAVARRGASLSDIFEEIEKEVSWKHAYDRLDLHLKGNALKNAVMEGLKDPPGVLAGSKVLSIEDLDGYKLNLDGDAWVLFRASGTEPVLRIYCEASSRDRVNRILEAADSFVRDFA